MDAEVPGHLAAVTLLRSTCPVSRISDYSLLDLPPSPLTSHRGGGREAVVQVSGIRKV